MPNCLRHLLARLVPIAGSAALAIALVTGFGPSAFAFDCLTTKPAAARGHWHTQVVAGKTCWFGYDWRSFLAKSKAQAEPSTAQPEPSTAQPELSAAQTEPAAAQAQPSPVTNTEPQQSPDPVASPVETTNTEQPQDPPGLRPATATEAAALINSISLEFEPAPSANPAPPNLPPKAPPEAHAQSRDTGDWLIAFGEFAIIGGMLAMFIKQIRRRRAAKRLRPHSEFVPVSLRFAPPLQPSDSADGQSPTRPPWATASTAGAETLPSAWSAADGSESYATDDVGYR